ncbi:EF-hand calcium-binding domain-containing protein 6-like isoform X2 [Argiope bruennichi]|uniref:EF-hand calcium-binding domain-containing protein 6-like isoform X2 n=1 Tax=Argiope bruennichi TaxID=94029 RepID=UPI002494E1B2|nr:EF-hand calcium-binding domain-containing protein 6-like isoform X2 [Argiope bruennichi]
MVLTSEEYEDFKEMSGFKSNKVEMKNDHKSSKSINSSTEISSVSSFTHYSKQDITHTNIRNIVSDKLSCRLYAVIQALKSFDKQKNGKILPGNLHNVLNIFCHPLSEKEFSQLLRKDELDENGFINYKSFLIRLTNKIEEINNAFEDKENDFNKMELNVEELEVKMKQKISKNLKNFIRSMWLYDFNQDGLIQKHEFRNVLENYCFHLTDDQFNRLWHLYDPVGRGVLNYKDFLLKLGTRSESYKRLVPRSTQIKLHTCTPSFNVAYSREEQVMKRCAKLGRDDPNVQGQVFNNIKETFRKKIEKAFPVLLRTFQIKDVSSSGTVPLSVFHQVLNYFVMPMSSQLFKQILMSFNISPTTNRIRWYDFLKSVCTSDGAECQSQISHASGSYTWHVCKSIFEKLKQNIKEPDNFFEKSFTMQSQAKNTKVITRSEFRRTINLYLTFPETSKGTTKHESEEMQLENPNAYLSREKLKKEFKKYFNKNLKNIEKAINAFDAEETGVMHLDDLKKILDSFCFSLSDSQFHELLQNFPKYCNKIFYSDLIKCYKKSPYEDEEKWALCVKKLTDAQDSVVKKMNNQELLKNVKEAVKAQKEYFLEEFKNYDYCNAGIARKEVLTKLLNKYVFRMTEEQINMLWNSLPLNEIGLLKYEIFLNDFIQDYSNHSESDKASVVSHLNIHSSSQSSRKSFNSANSLKERPKTASSISTASIRSYKSTVRPKSAFTKHSWEQQSLLDNESNRGKSESNLTIQGQGCSVLTNEQYKQFRSLNVGNVTVHSLSSANSNKLKRHENGNMKKNDSTKAGYSCQDIKQFVDSIKARWKDILRRCKAKDPDNINTIPWDDFINILPKTGVAINDQVLQLLDMEYNIRKNIPVNYWIFLKKTVLTLDSSGTNSRKTIHYSKAASKGEAVGLYKVLLSNREKILKNYRDLWYAFRKADREHSGSIKISEFRRILALCKIHLSEDAFFYICDYFDPKLTEKIHYEEFLEAFKQKVTH